MLAEDGWHPGVIGIVASRLVEHSGRPVVLIALDGDTGRASGRSVEAFDLLAGLSACGEHLLRYGGHRAAAGLEIERARVADFATALCAHAERVLRPQDLVPVERVDAIVGGDELGMALAEELQALAPFGRGNPAVSPDGRGRNVRRRQTDGRRQARALHGASRGARARGLWRSGPAGGWRSLTPGEGGDAGGLQATFTLEVNEWNGVSEPRLVLRRVQAAQRAACRGGDGARAAGARAVRVVSDARLQSAPAVPYP